MIKIKATCTKYIFIAIHSIDSYKNIIVFRTLKENT